MTDPRARAREFLKSLEAYDFYGCFCLTGDDGEPLASHSCTFCEDVDSLAAEFEAEYARGVDDGSKYGLEHGAKAGYREGYKDGAETCAKVYEGGRPRYRVSCASVAKACRSVAAAGPPEPTGGEEE